MTYVNTVKLLTCFVVLAFSQPVFADDHPPVAKLQLSASEHVMVVPDQAMINLSVVNQGKNAAAALATNSDAMQKAIDALKADGVAPKDIQTSNLSLQPQYVYKEGAPAQLSGYQASNTITLMVVDLKRVGALLDRVANLGVNSIDGPHFSVKDNAKAEDDARLRAMDALKQRAALYQKGMGIKLGRMMSLSENTSSPQPMVNYAVADMAAAPRAKSVPVEAGEMRVTARVSAEWEILP